MKYLKTFEKLGYEEEIENFSDILVDLINIEREKIESGEKSFTDGSYVFTIDPSLIPEKLMNGLKINAFFVVIYEDFNKKSMRVRFFKSGKFSAVLKLTLKDDGVIKKSTINHELMHFYQKLSAKKNTNPEHLNVLKVKHKMDNLEEDDPDMFNYLSDFRKLYYLTSDTEINARVQACYISLKEKGTTKETFLETIKDEYEYKNIKRIEKKIFNLLSLMASDDIEKFIDLWFSKIDRPLTKNPISFLGKKLVYFQKQKNKLKKKLMKLYGLFDTDELVENKKFYFEEDWEEIDPHTERNIEIIGYPNGGFIKLSQNELDLLDDNDLLKWDDDPAVEDIDYYGHYFFEESDLYKIGNLLGRKLKAIDEYDWDGFPQRRIIEN